MVTSVQNTASSIAEERSVIRTLEGVTVAEQDLDGALRDQLVGWAQRPSAGAELVEAISGSIPRWHHELRQPWRVDVDISGQLQLQPQWSVSDAAIEGVRHRAIAHQARWHGVIDVAPQLIDRIDESAAVGERLVEGVWVAIPGAELHRTHAVLTTSVVSREVSRRNVFLSLDEFSGAPLLARSIGVRRNIHRVRAMIIFGSRRTVMQQLSRAVQAALPALIAGDDGIYPSTARVDPVRLAVLAGRLAVKLSGGSLLRI